MAEADNQTPIVQAPFVQATAIRIGDYGIVIVGAPGAGKSTLALQILATARRLGHQAFLVCDDLVHLEWRDSEIWASAPHTMIGRIEIRGTGIGTIPFQPDVRLDLALAPVTVTSANRQPDPDATIELCPGMRLKVLPIRAGHPDPFAVLEAMIAGFPDKPDPAA